MNFIQIDGYEIGHVGKICKKNFSEKAEIQYGDRIGYRWPKPIISDKLTAWNFWMRNLVEIDKFIFFINKQCRLVCNQRLLSFILRVDTKFLHFLRKIYISFNLLTIRTHHWISFGLKYTNRSSIFYLLYALNSFIYNNFIYDFNQLKF